MTDTIIYLLNLLLSSFSPLFFPELGAMKSLLHSNIDFLDINLRFTLMLANTHAGEMWIHAIFQVKLRINGRMHWSYAVDDKSWSH